MKRILVTGASGFIGSHVLLPLKERGYEVVAVCRSSKNMVNFPFISCDLQDEAAVSKMLRQVKPSHLLHLAWYTEHGAYWNSERNLDWVRSSLHLVQSFIKEGGHRVVIGGSCAEYDWNSDIYPESMVCEPTSLYGKAKNCLRILIEEYAKIHPFSFAWGRIFFLYGPLEDPRKIVASIIHHLFQGKAFPFQNGQLIRDFMHVEDVAAALAAVIDSSTQGPVNIASGQGIALQEIGKKIEKLMGKDNLLSIKETANAPAPTVIADTTRLFQEIGWRPKYNLDKGLEHAISWWLQQFKH